MVSPVLFMLDLLGTKQARFGTNDADPTAPRMTGQTCVLRNMVAFPGPADNNGSDLVLC